MENIILLCVEMFTMYPERRGGGIARASVVEGVDCRTGLVEEGVDCDRNLAGRIRLGSLGPASAAPPGALQAE